jgi:hypothetical protein
MIAISEHPMEETFTDQSSLRTVVESIDREGTIDSVSCTDSTPSSSTPSSPQLSKKRAIDPLAKKSKKPRHDPSGDVDKSNIIVNKEANRRGRAQKALIDPKAPKYLTKAPVWDLGSNLNALQQIKLFFSSPCPSLICGSDQDQPFLCGALMEFRLREMLDCEIGGDLKDLVSYGGISNIPVERAMIVFEKAKDYEIPLPIANFRQWGRKSEQLARVWDGPLADLYYVLFCNVEKDLLDQRDIL